MTRNDIPLGMIPHNYSPQFESIPEILQKANKTAAEDARIERGKERELERIERAKEKAANEKKEVLKALFFIVIGVLLTKLADYFFK